MTLISKLISSEVKKEKPNMIDCGTTLALKDKLLS